jgi:hypothetical protein
VKEGSDVTWTPFFRRTNVVAQKPLEDQLLRLSDQAKSHVEIGVEPSARWVRAVVGGVVVAES